MKLHVQVRDENGVTKLEQELEVEDDVFIAPGATEITLEGVRTAIDYHLWKQKQQTT